MRVLPSVGAAAVAVAATVVLAPGASAHGNAPGDNGTIKIHDAKTGAELVKNEPHVCTFYLDAFFFDGLQKADWKIVDQPPTGKEDVVASTGAITLDGSGHGRTDDMTLPDGHYKLLWNFDGEHGKAKQKVFWVDCAAEGGTASGGTTDGGSTAGTTGGSTDGGSTTGTTTGGSDGGTASGGSTTGTTSGSTGGSTAAGGSTSGSTSGGDTSGTDSTSSPVAASSSGSTGGSGGSLAETGASVAGASVLGVVLLAIGAAVMFRRRGSRQH
ncbi:LPXTG cell wall anchor domain-containing protein [Actinacidiphila acididurans]|uniref:LPXTG cell wall anchor domain-containing protein n=1 Tax=Actinacidiphila acididurans TaxID=2784346 RepID=A0ABS2TN00_9ACTN|nr:LPXTG cell wall anchor domain-containing protein [Actinacidiphila acididurans]MBM9504187.1 LPXTG cell wall anchor domain-containing protein [Actinacidiphila acididurans]